MTRWIRRTPASMLTPRPTAAALLAAALMLGGAGAAVAEAVAPGTIATTTAVLTGWATGPELNIRQIYDRMDAAGYRELREIEWSDGRYEVTALDARGARVKLDVDGRTGEVLRSRTKNH